MTLDVQPLLASATYRLFGALAVLARHAALLHERHELSYSHLFQWLVQRRQRRLTCRANVLGRPIALVHGGRACQHGKAHKRQCKGRLRRHR